MLRIQAKPGNRLRLTRREHGKAPRGRDRRRTGKYVGGSARRSNAARRSVSAAEILSQVSKGIRWMPRRQQPKKDAVSCEKPWGAASRP
jgi:hypothetical protein